ncbi:MAG: Rpn family recombination-promoting nuclease/putative transposase [bacterium]|nr:Rpn family recombination-promoting nuclease/putative transposase [bacterium]MDE0417629.1 Rpn family recombination-promoting nuclease/putative transposase [bacterium]
MSLPSHPHDTLFRALVSAPPLAAALLADYLPVPVAALLDPDMPPEHVEGTFIDEEGARSQCDALFQARLRTGKPLHIYALVEHKSHIDETTPLQLLGYMVNIWRRDLAKGTGGLRPIVPLVFYHGRQEWRVPLSVAAMVDAPEVLAPYVRDFAYTLHDLGRIAPERLSRDPEVRSALVTLAVATTTDMGPEDLDLIGAALVADGVMERVILRYLAAVQDLTPTAMETSLRRTQPERWEVLMGTMAETWIEQGLSEGLSQGRAEGKAELLLRQMERRFGEVPDTVRTRVTGATTDELDAWSDVLLEAATLEDVVALAPQR